MVEKEPRFEKHFDDTQGCPYYFDRETGESIWELPDSTDESKDVIDLLPKVKSKLDEKEDLAKYQAHMN